MLSERENEIIEAAFECLTIAILHDEYDFEMEELYDLHERLQKEVCMIIIQE